MPDKSVVPSASFGAGRFGSSGSVSGPFAPPRRNTRGAAGSCAPANAMVSAAILSEPKISLLTLLSFPRTQGTFLMCVLLARLADEQILAFGGGDLGGDRALRHGPAAEPADGDFGADRESLPRPSRAFERQRARHLEVPRLHGPIRVFHVDVEVRMRIRPLDLRHDALHGDGLAAVIVGRPRVVR